MLRPLPTQMRAKVLAAAELFAEHGLDATKMDDIAVATGIPKATLYYYFEGKEDILSFLFTEILDEVGAVVTAVISADGDAAARLAAGIRAHLGVFVAFPHASRALQFDLGRAARLPLIAQRVDEAFVGPVRDLLVLGAQDGTLRPFAHPRLTATAILGAVTTTGLNALTGPQPRSLDDVGDELVDLVLSGVRA